MPKRKTPYRSKVKIGVDANGKDIVKYIQGYTREELRQARKAVIAQYITGEALASDRLFGDYASEWYRVKKAPFVSASSQQSYRTALNNMNTQYNYNYGGYRPNNSYEYGGCSPCDVCSAMICADCMCNCCGGGCR